ncbi:MAG: site-specific integrase [Ignavibacteriales bacterium]|nr:site-specific integrase [Ignavibacteriales bacterium]
MRVKFYLNYSVKREDKVIYAHIYLTKGSNKAYILNTGLSIAPKYWDTDLQRAKSRGRDKYPLYSEINSCLEKFKYDLLKIDFSSRQTNSNPTPESISKALDSVYKSSKEERGFFDYLDDFIDTVKNSSSKQTYYKYLNIKKLLTEFQEGTKFQITYESINLYFYDKLKHFLLITKNHSTNTTNRNIKFLKTFMTWSVDRRLTDNVDYRRFQLPKLTEKEVIYLTRDELNRFYDYQNFSTESLEKTRDLFCFQCFTGVRYSDIAQIRHEQIKNDFWHVVTQKTGDILKIPLNKSAQRILEKHAGGLRPLPVISNQKMNAYLKDSLREANIVDEIRIIKMNGSNRTEEVKPKCDVIGTHTARRTFVTLSLEAGMKPETIMKITGHSDYEMMKKYLMVTDQLTASEYNKAWNVPD